MLLNFSSGYFWQQGWIPPRRKQQLLWHWSQGSCAFLCIQLVPSSAAWPQLLHDALPPRDSGLTLDAVRLLWCPWLQCRWSIQVTLSSSLVGAAYRQQTCHAQVNSKLHRKLPSCQVLTASQVSFFSPETKVWSAALFQTATRLHSLIVRITMCKIESPYSRPSLALSVQWHNPHSLTSRRRMWIQGKSPWLSSKPLHQRSGYQLELLLSMGEARAEGNKSLKTLPTS